MKIAVYGGTFDPPHLGHVQAALAAAEALRPDKLLIIPTSVPPHKRRAQGGANVRQRLRMLEDSFRDVPGAEISPIELRRRGKSYTVETLRALHLEHPGAEFVLCMGTDMALSFPKWYLAEEITRLARIAAFSRSPADEPELDRAAAGLSQALGAELLRIPSRPVPVSSTRLRELLPLRQGREFLDPEVYALIIRERLYGAKPDLAWLREQARARLKPRRAIHTDGCEETAAALARRWGAPEETLREAAILHDVTRAEPLEIQLQMCAKYDMMPDNAEAGDGNLLHALSAAGLARGEFGMPEEVCSAIRWHTTGRAGMTLTEKILYLADAIEPNRDYPGVEELRRLAETDLDAALCRSLERTILYVTQQGKTPHPRSKEALSWLKGYRE